MQTILVWVFIICLTLSPQKNNGQYATINKTVNNDTYEYGYANTSFVSNVPLNEINSKAFKNFAKTYSTINNEKWVKVSNGIIVTFISDSIFYRIGYSEKGMFLYSYKYYTEKNCKNELKKMIQYIYPQYHISTVVELYDGHKLVYGINITNNEITRSLELDNGEIKTLDEFQNQKKYSEK